MSHLYKYHCLILADWLEERGDQRSIFLRQMCECNLCHGDGEFRACNGIVRAGPFSIEYRFGAAGDILWGETKNDDDPTWWSGIDDLDGSRRAWLLKQLGERLTALRKKQFQPWCVNCDGIRGRLNLFDEICICPNSGIKEVPLVEALGRLTSQFVQRGKPYRWMEDQTRRVIVIEQHVKIHCPKRFREPWSDEIQILPALPATVG